MESPEDWQKQAEDALAAIQQAQEKAIALLKRNPNWPGVVVRVNEGELEIQNTMPQAAKERLSDARLEHFLKILDVHGEAYLVLVSDLESVEAIAVVMEWQARIAWENISWLPFDMPSDPFGQPHPVHIQIDKVTKRARRWIVEAYRRLAILIKNNPPQLEASTPNVSRRKKLEPKPEKLANLDGTLNRVGAADALGITPRTLDRWVKDRKLAPVGHGHSKRLKARDLKKLLDQRILDKRDNK